MSLARSARHWLTSSAGPTSSVAGPTSNSAALSSSVAGPTASAAGLTSSLTSPKSNYAGPKSNHTDPTSVEAVPVRRLLLRRNVKRFRGVFQAHRLLHHSTLGLRMTKKKKKDNQFCRPNIECCRSKIELCQPKIESRKIGSGDTRRRQFRWRRRGRARCARRCDALPRRARIKVHTRLHHS